MKNRSEWLINVDDLLLNSVKCAVFDIGRKNSIQDSAFPPQLKRDQIHVWSARYGDLDQFFEILFNISIPKEKKAAFLYRKSADCKKYIIRQGLLRIILGHYTRQNPGIVSISTGINGKPEMDPLENYSDVSFNLSLTTDMVLIGVTKKRRIGVDIVKMDPSYPFNDIVEYLLTPAEKVFFNKIEPAMRYQAFFRIWTIKEAIIKVTGGTLNMMENTDLSEIMEDLLSHSENSMKYMSMQQPLSVWQFTCGSGHHGAMAVDGK